MQVYRKAIRKKKDFDENFDRTLPKYEIIPYVRYSLSKSQVIYYYIEAFASANVENTKPKNVLLKAETAITKRLKTRISTLLLEVRLVINLYFKEKFAVDLFVGMGKNLLNTDKSPELVPRVGASFGYRF